MHVGRDCKEITGFQRVRPNPEFDTAFINLLDHYTTGQESQWRLVLAGDFIDFMEVVIQPEAGMGRLPLSFEVNAEDREFGLGSEPERVVVKLEKTIEYHAAFFTRMAEYVKNGGELVLVRGNHDVEFFWSKVQRVFRKMLADLAFRSERLEVDDAIDRRNAFQQRVVFEPWAYVETGRIWVEHGHQYDTYCSFDHNLHPVSPTHPERIDTPISSFAMRYFVNLLNDFTAHHVDVWTWRDYVAWLKTRGLGGTLYIARNASRAALRAIEYSVRWTFGRVRRYAKEHRKMLREEAKRFGVAFDQLEEIDHLHHTPVTRNLPELLRLLFIDRILLGAAATFLLMVILIFVSPWWMELIGIVLLAIAVVRVNRFMVPRRYLLPGPKQAQAAKKICDLLGVPLVVMGHSHSRRVMDLGSGRRYINTGCWLPPFAEKDHVDPSQPCTCKLSHLVVDLDDRTELRVFCKAARTVRLADVDLTSALAVTQEHEALVEPAGGLVP